jgi:hypothetical protein
MGTGPFVTESNQRPGPWLVRIALARFRNFNDAFGDGLVNNARLPGFIQVPNTEPSSASLTNLTTDVMPLCADTERMAAHPRARDP